MGVIASFSIFLLTKPERIYNPISAMGFLQCLLFSWTTLRGKHCWHPIAVTGLVDTFGLRLAFHRFVHHGYSRIIIHNIVNHLNKTYLIINIPWIQKVPEQIHPSSAIFIYQQVLCGYHNWIHYHGNPIHLLVQKLWTWFS